MPCEEVERSARCRSAIRARTNQPRAGFGRRYVRNFDFPTQVECDVSRAPLPQRLQLCGFRALGPLAGAWGSPHKSLKAVFFSFSSITAEQSAPTFYKRLVMSGILTFASSRPEATIASSSAPPKESALVAAAKNGDRQAFEALVKRHQERILAIALRYTRTRHDAEDVLQQTFQKAFLYLHRFEGRSSFSTWLTRIAINEALMFLRQGRGQREERSYIASRDARFRCRP